MEKILSTILDHTAAPVLALAVLVLSFTLTSVAVAAPKNPDLNTRSPSFQRWAVEKIKHDKTNTTVHATRRYYWDGNIMAVSVAFSPDFVPVLTINAYFKGFKHGNIAVVEKVWVTSPGENIHDIVSNGGTLTPKQCHPGKTCRWIYNDKHPNRFLIGPLSVSDVNALKNGKLLKIRNKHVNGQVMIFTFDLVNSAVSINRVEAFEKMKRKHKRKHKQ